MYRIKFFSFLLLTLFFSSLQAQHFKTLTSGEIELALKKLNTVGSVLYVAAHPDDENTALLAYMANEMLLKTSYLSLTRGDGGQNLIGKGIREQLGLIRTQELLAAREIDGADQYFTRANDFGYSKSPEEALKIWGKNEILSDVVWIIRKTRPDIIITRFPTDGGGGHGHHTASALLAEEAFHAAADPDKFPEQLKWVKPWQAKRIFWNAWRVETGMSVDVGLYNPLLGKSYTEIAAESRSMHKSQGFGVAKSRGTKNEYLSFVAGEKALKTPFEGIDLSWKRVKGSDEFAKLIQDAVTNFTSNNPSASIATLLKAYKALQKVEDNFWKKEKSEELKQIILACAGFYYETTANSFQTYPGGKLDLTLTLLNRSNFPVSVKAVKYPDTKEDTVVNKALPENQPLTLTTKLKVSNDKEYSEKYWLKEDYSIGLYSVSNQEMIGRPENKPAFVSHITVDFDGVSFTLESPLVYKWTDPVDGERFRDVTVLPEVIAETANKVYIFPKTEAQSIDIRLTSQAPGSQGKISLQVPAGWKVEPAFFPFQFKELNEELRVSFNVTPGPGASSGEIKALVKSGEKTASKSKIIIDYDHIPIQTLLPEASAKLVRLDLVTASTNVGYIEGAGDEIPEILKQAGYRVTMLSPQQLKDVSQLSKFDAIIMGVRAFNTNESLKTARNQLMSYVNQGGNLIVQYNTSSRLIDSKIGPYPIELSRDRVTDEFSKVEILKPQHPLLNYPNKISGKDFEGWVQERGLYFPGTWDEQYQTVISTNDPGEKDLESGILAANYGKGTYIYTSYSWFRQLPEGVPGALRIFANLIAFDSGDKSEKNN